MKKVLAILLLVCLFLLNGCSAGAEESPELDLYPEIVLPSTAAVASTKPPAETMTPVTETTEPVAEVTHSPAAVASTSPTTETMPPVTETMEPVVEVTNSPEISDAQLENWQIAYLDFLESKRNDHLSFALVYVDEDSIPELYLSGNCEALGDGVCTYKDDTLIELRLSRTHGGRYIEHSGILLNQNGNMGHYTTKIYTLTDSGFTNIFTGLQEEFFVTDANDETYLDYEYSIGDRTVSEEEFNTAVAEIFDLSSASRFDEYAVGYEQIIHEILDGQYGLCEMCGAAITAQDFVIDAIGLCINCYEASNPVTSDYCVSCGWSGIALDENNLCEYCANGTCSMCRGPLGEQHDCDDYPNAVCSNCGWGIFTTGVGIDGLICPDCGTRVR